MVGSRQVVDYRRQFRLGAPPQVVWAALEDFCSGQSSSPWVRDLEVQGPGLCDGSVLRATIATPLPYRMKVVLEVQRCVPPGFIVGRVSGDLRGEAELALEDDGDDTWLELAWTLQLMQRSMRSATKFAGPILRWGHHLVVEHTVEMLKARVIQLFHPGRPATLEDF
jgi:carbon monoxide dehydrogenase subunit G